MVIGIIAGTVCGIILLLMIVLYVIYRLTFFYSPDGSSAYDYIINEQTLAVKPQFDEAISRLLDAKYKDIIITSEDNLLLYGRFYQTAIGAPVAILFHGYRGHCVRDWAGGYSILQNMGYNILLVDQRAHGASQGHSTTFGIKEQLDCLCWIDYVNKHYDNPPILLMGISMGGATVIMASKDHLPTNVKCIVADCPYDTPANIIKKVISVELKLNQRLLYPVLRLAGRIYARCDLEKDSPLSSIATAKVPILLIHGKEDTFVPYSMSQRLHQIAPAKSTLCIIEGAGHTLSQYVNPTVYAQELQAFCTKHINVKTND